MVCHSNILLSSTSSCWHSAPKSHWQEYHRNLTPVPQLFCYSAQQNDNVHLVYISEVLDIYRKGNNSKYGSLEFATSASSLPFLVVHVYLPSRLQPGHVCFSSSHFKLAS